MRALTWQGIEDVKVTEVPDPRVEEPTDAVVRVTSTVWKTVTCGAVNALATIASAVRLRTDFTGTRVSRPSSVSWSASGPAASFTWATARPSKPASTAGPTARGP